MDTILDSQVSAAISAKGRGRLQLQPLAGSVDRSTFAVDIDLFHDPVRLTVGDLRRRAEQSSDAHQYEQAFRLWSAVRLAAEKADFGDLAMHASGQADGAQHRAQFIHAAERRNAEIDTDRSSTKYDYEALNADVQSGMTKSATARKWGCAPSTVQRAVDYVGERDELLEQSPEVLDQMMAGVDVATLSSRYGVSTKVLRWMVNTSYNRRAHTD